MIQLPLLLFISSPVPFPTLSFCSCLSTSPLLSNLFISDSLPAPQPAIRPMVVRDIWENIYRRKKTVRDLRCSYLFRVTRWDIFSDVEVVTTTTPRGVELRWHYAEWTGHGCQENLVRESMGHKQWPVTHLTNPKLLICLIPNPWPVEPLTFLTRTKSVEFSGVVRIWCGGHQTKRK